MFLSDSSDSSDSYDFCDSKEALVSVYIQNEFGRTLEYSGGIWLAVDSGYVILR